MSMVNSWIRKGLASATLLFVAQSSYGMCFEDAGIKYKVNANLLRGIAIVESSMNPGAMNYNNPYGSSYDIGLMQINSGWLKTLGKFGITERTLRTDPCMNVMVGAWILASNMQRMGENWNAVGAYNAACTSLKGDACSQARNKYVTKVWNAMNRPAKGARHLNQDSSQFAAQYAAQQAHQSALARQAEYEAKLREIESRKRLTRIEISNSMAYVNQASNSNGVGSGSVDGSMAQRVSYVEPSNKSDNFSGGRDE